jgi:glycosyltransferase AglD
MISILIPVFNEEAVLAESVETLRCFLSKDNLEYEILLLDNGSTDKTAEISRELGKKYPNIRYFYTPVKGPGQAFVMGVENARYEYLISLDADLSSDIEFVTNAIHLLKQAPIVIGSKSMGNQDRVFLRILFSHLYILLSQLFFGLTVSDYSLGAKGYHRSVLLPILPYLDKWTGYVLEICIYLKLQRVKIIQISVDCKDLRKSHFNLLHEGFYRYGHILKCWYLVKKERFLKK